ncbi:ABC transporter substrate-binding protein [Rhodococcus sp. HNM0569]|uniref:ABC transporter substrate-binding protein n=1 Tax=Rhodococcus sp. HNM0569 TaxID=2716340 RepID=UPI00146B9390|nr:ABC transporter substrate-binding protein [Rhodococcus sp. HNM0569]NLU83037.1 ABC transporter substrate-binding protein [Rhodococcus sp. HNM0569]
MSSSRPHARRAWAALVGIAILATAACVDNTAAEMPGVDAAPVEVEAVPDIASRLPAPVASSGVLRVGVNVPYAPNEFKDPNGEIVGFDVDLMNALASVLGLTAQFNEADFDRIIPAVEAGTYDLGMSSFTDTKEREETVDFVTYYHAGSQWVQPPGGDVDPENACGLRVAVQTATSQDLEELPARNQECLDAGRPAIDILKYDSQDDAAQAVALGRVDAMSADSPVAAYAVERGDGQLELTGGVFDAAPYGWAVAKGSPLAPVLRDAMQHLIDDGAYRTIAENWGVENGLVETSVVNGATS